MITFHQPDLLENLKAMDTAALDDLPFGVIGMAPGGAVISYNVAESRLSGLTRAKVMGRNFSPRSLPVLTTSW